MLKKAIDTSSFIYLKHALPPEPRLMCIHLVDQIKLVGQAMIDLHKVCNVAPMQPIEQKFWYLVDEVNSNLHWIQGNSELCFGWGPLLGGLGSIEGGFVSDWEDL